MDKKCNLLTRSLKSFCTFYSKTVDSWCVEYCVKHLNASEISCVHFCFLNVQQAAFKRISAKHQVHEKAVFVSSCCEMLWCKINAAYKNIPITIIVCIWSFALCFLRHASLTLQVKYLLSYVDKYLIRAKDGLLQADKDLAHPERVAGTSFTICSCRGYPC